MTRAGEFLKAVPLDYASSDALLDLAIWKAPTNSEAYLLLASSLADRRQYEQAAGVLQSGIEKVSDGKVTLIIALAENAVRKRDLAAARSIYEKAVAMLGDQALIGIAKTYLTEQPPNREKALEYALKATAQYPTSVEAYALVGQVALSKNDLKMAEEYFEKGRVVSPGSPEIISRLSSFYDRAVLNEQRKRNWKGVIEYLTKSISLSPSLKKYYDRGREYFRVYENSPDDRITGYRLSADDYRAALDIAKAEDGVFAQFPWLLPNLIEALIFQGEFGHAKKLSEELFKALGTDAQIRPPTDPRELRIIGAFLNAVAQLLDSGTADKEVYLMDNATLGRNLARSPWGFSEMQRFLVEDYAKVKTGLSPDVRQSRIALVQQWVNKLTAK